MTKTNDKGLLLTPGFLSRFCALMLFIICSVERGAGDYRYLHYPA